MSEENKNLEMVDAEVVTEGAKAVTMDDIKEEHGFEENKAQEGFAKAEETASAGTVYEEKTYTVKPSRAMGIIGLILGIFSIICCCTCWGGVIAGAGAIIFGIISLKNEPENKTIAIISIVCGGIGLALGLITVLFAGMFGSMGDMFDDVNIDPELFDKLENLGNL